jgi:hypothetical protein
VYPGRGAGLLRRSGGDQRRRSLQGRREDLRQGRRMGAVRGSGHPAHRGCLAAGRRELRRDERRVPVARPVRRRRPAARPSTRDERDRGAVINFETARLKFAESQRLDPSTGGVFNLAHAEEKVGLIASAWQHYYDVIGQLSPSDGRIAFARARVAALEPRLPRLLPRELGCGRSGGRSGARGLWA